MITNHQRHRRTDGALSTLGDNTFLPQKGMKNQTVNDGVAHSKNPRKCAYHVTFDLDLDLDLEHTLNACWPGVHLMQVWWRSGHLPARRSDLRKSLQTDRQTDGRTDDGRLAMVLAHSWNELMNTKYPNFTWFFSEKLAKYPNFYDIARKKRKIYKIP